jgi:hypothetical protein
MGSLTDGIRLMDRMLTDHEMKILESHAVPQTNWIPGANQEDGMPKEYWVRFKKEINGR